MLLSLKETLYVRGFKQNDNDAMDGDPHLSEFGGYFSFDGTDDYVDYKAHFQSSWENRY